MKQKDFIKDADSDEIIISDVKKRKLDIVPRIICLIFAIFVWIYFVNINDSSVTATFKVKLDVSGTEKTVTYSLAQYINSTDADVAKALYSYSMAARAYKAITESEQ